MSTWHDLEYFDRKNVIKAHRAKNEATLYIAEGKINEMMTVLDLRPPGKYYVGLLKVSFTTTSTIDDNYFMDIIEKSFEMENGNCIVAIEYMNNLYVHPSVKEISDGKTTFFVNL